MKHTAKKCILLLAGLALAAVLSGCTFFDSSVEQLFTLPRMAEEYTGLSQQIDSLIDQGYEYASPSGGRNIQSVQMVDLEDDGIQEALVFLRRSSDEKPLKIMVFRLEGDTYRCFCTIESSGSAVDSVYYQDLNGDGQMMPDDDLYGLLGGNDVMAAFFYGSGSSLVTHDETGAFALTFGSERDINAATKVVEMMNQKWFMNHHTISNTDDTYYRQLFESGHGLFFWMRLDDVTNMRAGEADFGIIPTPKYEESQDAYYSMVSQHTTGLMSVPITLTGDKLSEVGMVLEALAAESHYTLIPEYIETSLKTKNSRDAESADMLDIIINNRVFDPMLIYNFGGFADSFMELGKNNNTDIASFLKSKQKVVDKMIKKTTEALEAADAEA